MTVSYPITDAQVHIWGEHTSDRPWPAEGRTRAHRPTPFGIEKLLPEMDAAGVDRVVLVPPSFEGDRNDLVLAAAARHPGRFAVMARLPVADPAAPGLLSELVADPSVLGLRLTFDKGDSARWLDDGTAEWIWEALLEAGLAVMIWAPGRFTAIARVCETYPGLRVVFDSLGLAVGLKDDDIDAPLRALVELAKYPNLAVKAAALPSYVSDPYPFRSLAPKLRLVIDAFGPERVFWASDLTRIACTYNECARFLGDLEIVSDDDLALIMGQGVSKWLGWSDERYSSK